MSAMSVDVVFLPTTETDAYPLPTIGENHLWSVLDLKDAFSQISLAKSTPSYTATSTPR